MTTFFEKIDKFKVTCLRLKAACHRLEIAVHRFKVVCHHRPLKKVLSLKTPLNPFRYEGDIREGVKGVCKLKFGN